MTFVQHDGAGIWFDDQGDGDPVTTIGGFAMAHTQFHFVFPKLLERHRVISWDFRGIGASDRPPGQEYSVDTKVEDLRAVLDAAGVERTHLWAAATGSYTAIRFAARYPERVGAVIHYGQCRPTPGGIEMYEEMARTLDGDDWVPACHRLLRVFSAPEEYHEWIVSLYLQLGSPEVLKRSYYAEIHTDVTADLARTTAPMMILIGAKGSKSLGTSYGSGYKTALELRPDSELVVLEDGSGTYNVIDCADETVAAALEFFARHPLERSDA